jgi:spermidine/putrescine transport system permease protein
VLTPAQYGGVIWQPSFEAYIRLLFERDIFDDSTGFQRRLPANPWPVGACRPGTATLLCLLIGLPTAWFIATPAARGRSRFG